MTERSGFVKGRYVEDLPATLRSTGEPPGPELTGGAPIDPSTPATESTADFAGCAGPGTSAGGESAGAGEPGAPVEEQLGAASASVTKAVDDVIVAVRTLVGTDEGHRYIEARVNRAGETLSSVLRDLQARVDGTLKKQ
jgi:hypothetical protein